MHQEKINMFFQWQGDDLLLDIRVQPRASSNGFAEELHDRIKLRITPPRWMARPTGIWPSCWPRHSRPLTMISASFPVKPGATSASKYGGLYVCQPSSISAVDNNSIINMLNT